MIDLSLIESLVVRRGSWFDDAGGSFARRAPGVACMHEGR
jgi:hypothetical protein